LIPAQLLLLAALPPSLVQQHLQLPQSPYLLVQQPLHLQTALSFCSVPRRLDLLPKALCLVQHQHQPVHQSACQQPQLLLHLPWAVITWIAWQ
jgi:hypothetical protein